jgi:hypothetical protein
MLEENIRVFIEKNLYKSNGVLEPRYLNKLDEEAWAYIREYTKLLPEDTSDLTRFRCFLVRRKNIPICPKCGNSTNWDRSKKDFGIYCSKICRNTCEKLKKRGSESPLSKPSVREKIYQTNKKRYGFTNPMQNEKIKAKAKKTNLKKYGCTNPMQNEKIKAKVKKNNLKKYKCESVPQSHIKHLKKWNSKKWFLKRVDKKSGQWELGREYVAKYFGVTKGTVSQKLLSLGISLKGKRGSEVEDLLYTWIRELYQGKIQRNINFIATDRDGTPPLELDIYLPDVKVALEIDGNIWHSYGLTYPNNFQHLDKRRALRKTELCEEQGITLVRVREWEVEAKPDLIRSMLSLRVNRVKKRVYARKTFVKTPSKKDMRLFLEENHLQGFVGSKYDYGLYHDTELVSVMSFGKNRYHDKEPIVELLRFATKVDTQVVGGFSKLLKAFQREHPSVNKILSYASRDISVGNVYESVGFTWLRNSEPDYWYLKDGKKLSRYQAQKHKLKELLDNFKEEDSELVNMVNHGWRVQYGSGNRVYMWSRKKSLKDTLKKLHK